MASDFEYLGQKEGTHEFRENTSGTLHRCPARDSEERVEMLDGDQVLLWSMLDMGPKKVWSIRKREVVEWR